MFPPHLDGLERPSSFSVMAQSKERVSYTGASGLVFPLENGLRVGWMLCVVCLQTLTPTVGGGRAFTGFGHCCPPDL